MNFKLEAYPYSITQEAHAEGLINNNLVYNVRPILKKPKNN